VSFAIPSSVLRLFEGLYFRIKLADGNCLIVRGASVRGIKKVAPIHQGRFLRVPANDAILRGGIVKNPSRPMSSSQKLCQTSCHRTEAHSEKRVQGLQSINRDDCYLIPDSAEDRPQCCRALSHGKRARLRQPSSRYWHV